MKLRDMILMSVGNLYSRKVRTLLTVAGVIIGTCAIVVMLSLGIGMKQSMINTMQDMGDLTVIQVQNGGKSQKSSALDEKMLEKFRKIPNVVALTPVYYADNITIRCKKYQYCGQICGVDMTALKAFGYELTEGKLPDENGEETDILFGSNAAYQFAKRTSNGRMKMVSRRSDKNGKKAEPYVHPMKDKFEIVINKRDDEGEEKQVGRPIKLNVLGTLAEDWGKEPSPGYSIFMDYKYAEKLMEKYKKVNKIKEDPSYRNGCESVSIKVSSVDQVADAEQAVKDLGFDTYSMETIREPMEKQMRTVQMILGGLGAISLLVAALGITNTMIMSIYERTREIGIMKVLGCVVRNIRTMFLMEAGAIGFLGGVAGVSLSYGISFLINSIASGQSENGGGDFLGLCATGCDISIIPVWLVLGALLFATMIGLLSGLHPANRAMKISALTAIRQE